MKRLMWVALAALALGTTSCEMTREITIKSDGSGTYVSSVDMGGMLEMARNFGGEGTKELEGKKMDSSISLIQIVDSIPGLTDAERKLAEKGTFRLLVDADNSQMLTAVTVPFSSYADLNLAHGLTGKSGGAGLLEMMAKGEKMKEMEGMDELNEAMPSSTLDDYYSVEFNKGTISKKLNAEKYASVASDQSLQQMKEMASQGMSQATKIIIHLPSPAKKAEGVGVSLSEDKKTVTINESMEDFFDDGKKLEFLIEY